MSEAILVDLGTGRSYPATPGSVFGREACEILVSDPEVSRRHATLISVEGGLGIEDAGSRNGTFVNERRIDGTRLLNSGDRIRVGDTVLRFESAPDSPAGGEPQAMRGDVTAPEPVPSVVRRAPPLEVSGPPAFPAPQRRIRGSAARRAGATVICFLVVAATAVAVVLYFVAR